MSEEPLPRAPLLDVLLGRAPLVGARFDRDAPRGLVSPVEARSALGIPYGDLAEAERTYLESEDRRASSDAEVLVRAAVASALSPSGMRVEDRPAIVSAEVDNVTIDEAVERIMATPPRDRARVVFFVHPHALNLAAFDRSFAELVATADLVLPDGIGIRLAARTLGLALRHNINGTDLLPLLCAAAAERRIPLVLVGAADGIAATCAENLRRDHPGLEIPLATHGYLDDDASRALAARIRALAPAIVLCGMGSPRQERWIEQYLRDIPSITAVTVGGLFDFFSGRMRRAPIEWRELGLEWLFRLGQEPTRLARRYLLGNPVFLGLAAAQRAGLVRVISRRRPP